MCYWPALWLVTHFQILHRCPQGKIGTQTYLKTLKIGLPVTICNECKVKCRVTFFWSHIPLNVNKEVISVKNVFFNLVGWHIMIVALDQLILNFQIYILNTGLQLLHSSSSSWDRYINIILLVHVLV